MTEVSGALTAEVSERDAARASLWWDAWAIGAAALVARLCVAAWAAPRFPPAGDGTFYHRFATRIAEGLGYTWPWPDGAVTYAAHYPVGYPAALGAVYALFGQRPGAAMALHAAVGALAAIAVHRVVARAGSRRAAAAAGLLVAAHPGLVAYTPAFMTEGVTATLVACAAWAAAKARDALSTGGGTEAGDLRSRTAGGGTEPGDLRSRTAGGSSEPGDLRSRTAGGSSEPGDLRSRAAIEATTLVERTSDRHRPDHQRQRQRRRAIAATIAAGLILGAATLVRPQSLVLAPLLGALAWAGRARSRRSIAGAAAAATIAALVVCAPWTIRNCVRMKSCALVSVNGGWNLLIGADRESTGAWSPIKVPEACREVWDEAAKDACFGREARRYIAAHPLAWLSLVPRKLAATFDYCGAPGGYLSMSNPAAFGDGARTALGVVEMVYERAVLLLAIVWAARSRLGAAVRSGRRTPLTVMTGAVAAVGLLFLLLVHAWVSYLAFVLLTLLRGNALFRGPLVASSAAAVLGATIATHAVFFGAGRYALIVFPLLCGVAALGAFPPAPSAASHR